MLWLHEYHNETCLPTGRCIRADLVEYLDMYNGRCCYLMEASPFRYIVMTEPTDNEVSEL